MDEKRRKFIKASLFFSLGIPLTNHELWSQVVSINEKIKISLQCYSFASLLRSKKMNILDFPRIVRQDFNIDAAEYWNYALASEIKNPDFIREINMKTDDYGIENTIMLVDLIDFETGESKSLCSQDKKERNESIEGHKKWIEIANSIGCKTIRLNLWSKNLNVTEVKKLSMESLNKLLDFCNKEDMSIVIENHGGFTSDAKWLVDLIKNINNPRLGTLPDFGTPNFCIQRAPKKDGEKYSKDCINQYDKYKGVEEMLPYAKGISAKSHIFNKYGEEVNTDFEKMIKLIKASSFQGHIAIEYEGAMLGFYTNEKSEFLSPHDGVLATKRLIEKYL